MRPNFRGAMARAASSMALIPFSGAAPAIAGDFDGKKPLQCFVGEIQECQPARECLRLTAAEVDLPEIIQIDFEAKELRGVTPEGRSVRTPIRSITKEGGSVSKEIAVQAITLAAVSNTLVKAAIVFAIADRSLKKVILPGFLVIALAGLGAAFA